jgi:outer membrane beta-barrel protein
MWSKTVFTKKANRLELAVRYGFWGNDPFVDQISAGLSLGYHFNELLSVHVGFSTIVAQLSSAAKAYAQASTNGLEPSVNMGRRVINAESKFSLIYGKLSLLGKAIIYYDMNLAVGAAQITSDFTTRFAPEFGLGQQIFLGQNFVFNADYRMLFSSESYNDRSGNPFSRNVTTNWVILGIGYLF